MFDLFRRHIATVATCAVAAALTVGGVALAQGGSGGGDGQGGSPKGKRMPPPPMLPGGKDLTYAQLHVQREGEDQVIRIDRGKVTAASESSITLEENDGNEVTIALDGETEVLAGPGRHSSPSDLTSGQQVTVCGPEGEAAKAVMVEPKGGRISRGAQVPGNGQLPPPPPGAQGGPPQMQG